MGSKTYSPIARTQIARLKKDLDALIERCESATPGTEVQSDLFQYAHVRLCGFLEQSLLWVGRAQVHRQTVAEAQTFALSHLDRHGRNPTDDAILAFVNRFSPGWALDLTEWFEIDGRGNTIDALVGIRNGIAHGTSLGVSSRSFASYYVVVDELVEWLVERFDPLPKPTTA